MSSKKKADWRSNDPKRRREAGRYDRPLPSREFLLQLMHERNVPLRKSELFDVLELADEQDREALTHRLRAMVRDGQLLRNRAGQYCLLDKMPLVTGKVIGHRDGFGFVQRDDGDSDDVYLSSRQMRDVMHGDRVAVRTSGNGSGRTEGRVVEVLERGQEELVGRYFSESGVGFVIPDNSRVTHKVVVPRGRSGRARSGQVVLVHLDEYPTRHAQPIGSVVEVLGGDHTPGIETEIAIRTHDLPHEWPDAVETEMQKVPSKVSAAAWRGREDLRDLPLVTIDGADARDFDDAVHATATPRGWKLYVAIADVAQYVKPETALDQEATRRGTSVYFPTRVIPMLPEALSNGLCSLNPDVDRLCMVCEMLIDRNGKVTRSRFYEAVMRSSARLTYTEVAAALYDNDKAALRKVGGLLKHLQTLDDVYRVFAKARKARGAIEIETTEIRFQFNEKGRIEGVQPYRRNDAHKVIEECMIAANIQAARFLKKRKLPTLYRRHDAPEEERRDKLVSFLKPLNLRISKGDKVTPADYAKLLASVRGRPDAELIETVLLRSMPQAVYSPESEGHFGLALDDYAHFTSPIRRYPDLLVHRGIKHLLAGGKVADFRYNKVQMAQLGQHCSAVERRADEATRDATDWLKCEYMQDKVGDVFDGTVSSVTSFGLFVQLDGIGIEGLVHISSLGEDYFHHDPATHKLVGENTGKTYQLADRLKVRVSGASMEERKIDFKLASDTPRSGGRNAGSKKSAGRKQGKGQGKGKGKGKNTRSARAGAGKNARKTKSKSARSSSSRRGR